MTGHIMVSVVVVIVVENMKYVMVLAFDCLFFFIFFYYQFIQTQNLMGWAACKTLFYFQFFQFIHKKRRKKKKRILPAVPRNIIIWIYFGCWFFHIKFFTAFHIEDPPRKKWFVKQTTGVKIQGEYSCCMPGAIFWAREITSVSLHIQSPRYIYIYICFINI